MKSHQVLKNAFAKSSPKSIAAELGISLSLVYKWAQEQSDNGSGSTNPLDRVLHLYELTGDERIIEFLAKKCDGYFVRNPTSQCQQGFQYLPATTEIVSQFSSLLDRISRAALDNSITGSEANDIRLCWDKLKGFAEGFVRCCEEGDFEQMHLQPSTSPQNAEPRKTLY